ncbi:MAG TPA: GH32 C-terminal domain-containing protein [Candidatus Brocadiia bacterium]|nr:GH32 C-terminal domain-containing protein [Candidatus Brocadiia bacterium]
MKAINNHLTISFFLFYCLPIVTGSLLYAADDILIADFEGKDYGQWKVEGTAFGHGPARGTLPNQMEVSGFRGGGLVNSYFGMDGSTGKLTSPPFKIERKFINFLIGGGKYPGKTCMNLIIAGEAVRTATGPNDRDGGSERLAWQSWDVSDLTGRTATIEIVDERSEGWGHVNVDHIFQSDEQAMKEMQMEITVVKRYLNIPVRTGAPKQRMKLLVEEKIVREFEIELAEGDPQFWAFVDLSDFAGKKMTICVDALDKTSKAAEFISQDDAIRGADDLYREKLRPQFHFSSRRGWNNDPNGLCYYDGEYHLYYQHNPYGWNWGNMHWGHAVSRDLVRWKELPIAIYPHEFGDWVFSGSATVDADNTAGFRTGSEDVIVAAYTSTGRGEAIVYSNDRGRTFTEYEGNPVVKHQGRDPKLLWHKAAGHWVMAVYDEKGDSKAIAFYSSPNLKDWKYESREEGFFECPEIFELPVDGDAKNTRWILYSGDGAYSIGAFDGREFKKESGKHRFNFGNCFYASQTFSDIRPEDGRRIQIGWGQTGDQSMPFNQMMDFPVELTLRATEEGIRMFAQPGREIEVLHRKKHSWKNVRLASGGKNPIEGIECELLEIRAEFEPGTANEVGLNVHGLRVAYNCATSELVCDQNRAALKPVAGRIRLRLLVDRTSVEIFANGGRIYMPMRWIPPAGANDVEVFCSGGEAQMTDMQIYELNSAWE